MPKRGAKAKPELPPTHKPSPSTASAVTLPEMPSEIPCVPSLPKSHEVVASKRRLRRTSTPPRGASVCWGVASGV